MRKTNYFLFLLCVLTFWVSSCGDDGDEPITENPNVKVIEFNSINDTTCFFTGEDVVTVTVENFDVVDVQNFRVSYQVFGKETVEETFTNVLKAGKTAQFTFQKTVDLTKSYNNEIRAWASSRTEQYITNNSTKVQINCVEQRTVKEKKQALNVKNQMILKYNDNSTRIQRNDVQAYLADNNIAIIQSIECDGISVYMDLLSIPDALIGSESQKEKLQGEIAEKEGVEGVEFNLLSVNTNTSPAPPTVYFPSNSQAPLNLPIAYGNADTVKIVILDTGLDTTDVLYHEFLYYQKCPTCSGLPTVRYGYDYVNNDHNPHDDNWHGTDVAHVIANQFATQNQPIHIIPLKVLDHDGYGTLWNICLGTVTARLLYADIINASFGWSETPSPILEGLIEKAGENCHGVFITSAGNDTTSNDLIPHWPSNYTNSLDNVIAVTATGNENQTQLANYANYSNAFVDVAILGTHETKDHTGSSSVSRGTSLAAAYLTAQVAKMLMLRQGLSAEQIKSQIRTYNPNGVRNASGQPAARAFISDTIIDDIDNNSTNTQTWLQSITIGTDCGIKSCSSDTSNDPIE